MIKLIKNNILPDDTCDIILNWGAERLKNGPGFFSGIMLATGSQVQGLLNIYESYLRQSDCLSTIPGLLHSNLLLTSIIPNEYQRYHVNFRNIVDTLIVYQKKDNLVRSISTFIPEYRNADIIIECIKTYMPQITTLKEFRIFYLTNKEEEVLKSLI